MKIKQSITIFIQNQKQKQLSVKMILMMCFSPSTIITNIQKPLEKSLGWIIDLVIDHTISISKYNPFAGTSYVKLLKEIDLSKKRLD